MYSIVELVRVCYCVEAPKSVGAVVSQAEPPENCQLNVKMAILLKKMTIFVNFFEKNVKFLAIF